MTTYVYSPPSLLHSLSPPGPQCVGRIVDDAIGACFAWGVLIDGHFLFTGPTFNIATVFLSLIHVPIVLLLTLQVGERYLQVASKRSSANDDVSGAVGACSGKASRGAMLRTAMRIAIHGLITILQICMGLVMYSAYGGMALASSFLYVWSLPLYAYCWFTCLTLTRDDFINSTDIATSNDERDNVAEPLTGRASPRGTCSSTELGDSTTVASTPLSAAQKKQQQL